MLWNILTLIKQIQILKKIYILQNTQLIVYQ